MLVKLFGSALLVLASFAAGCSASRSLYKRRNFLKSFLVFLDQLSTNIRYNSDDIFTLVSRCADCEELSCFCIDTADKSQPFDKLWSKCVITIPKAYALKKDDKGILSDFGLQLGKTDVEGQLKHIELYKQLLQKQLSDSEEAISKKSKLYKTLGLFAGTATALMMM